MTAPKKKKKLKNPAVLILAALLLFLIIGVSLSGLIGGPGITVAIDAAYGGDQTGYTGFINESDYNEGVVNALCERLAQDDRITLYRTHEAGTAHSVLNTAKEVNEKKADIVLSIHAGYDPDPAVTGMRIYTEKPSTEEYERSLNFAETIQKAFQDEIGTEIDCMYYEKIGEDKYQMKVVPAADTADYELDTWTLMEKTVVPVVVTEQIYVSNESDVEKWANPEAYAKTAELYYQAICEYFGLNPEPAKNN